MLRIKRNTQLLSVNFSPEDVGSSALDIDACGGVPNHRIAIRPIQPKTD
jgi:hypothetical protein